MVEENRHKSSYMSSLTCRRVHRTVQYFYRRFSSQKKTPRRDIPVNLEKIKLSNLLLLPDIRVIMVGLVGSTKLGEYPMTDSTITG